MNILIIDSNQSLQNIICDYFNKKEHSVEIVTDGYKLIEKITKVCYQLIILNFRMDKISWLSVCNLIKRTVPAPKILLVSGYYSNDDYHSCIRYKIYPDGFIYIPFDTEKVYETISKIVKNIEAQEDIKKRSQLKELAKNQPFEKNTSQI